MIEKYKNGVISFLLLFFFLMVDHYYLAIPPFFYFSFWSYRVYGKKEFNNSTLNCVVKKIEYVWAWTLGLLTIYMLTEGYAYAVESLRYLSSK